MPGDMSSSSSEDEDDGLSPEPSVKQKEPEMKTRYQCPADFISFSHKPCSSTLTESLKNSKKELWLIKAPDGFNPECFSGIKVPLSGLQTLKVPNAAGGARTASGQQIYNILASSHGTSHLCLLTGDKQPSDEIVFGPAFSGLLNVCESYEDSSANWNPQVIATAPAPSIPLGLKQRFQSFGSKSPSLICVAENEMDGAAVGPSSTTLRPPVGKRLKEEARNEEEENERRKKKKKEKQIKTEMEEVEKLVRVKLECEAEIQDEVIMELPFLEGDVLEEKRKKKKKKKNREREELEEAGEPSVREKMEEVTVKCEPIETLYDNVVEGKKKKKKKKRVAEND